MTVSSTDRTAGPFEGSGVETAFPFTFRIFTEADIVATLTVGGVSSTLTRGTHYTVAINADQSTTPGGTLTLLTPLALGETLNFTTDIAPLQGARLRTGGAWRPEVVEEALDRAMVVIQQQQVVGEQTLRVPESAGVSALPTATLRALRLPCFDADGDADVTSFTVDQLAAAVAAAYAAGASADAVTFLQTASTAFARSVQAKLRERISVMDFVPTGVTVNDGLSHPLSDVYATLGAAQVVYPHATSLTQQIAWAALQAALNHAATIAGSSSWDETGVGVEVPYGSYYTGASSVLMNSPGICLYGMGRGSRIFTDQNIECIVLGDSTDATSILELHLQDLFIANTSTTNTGIGLALYRAGSGSITGCTLRNFDVQIDTHRANRMMVMDTNFNSARTTIGTAHIRISGSASGNGGGIHLANLEVGNSSTAILPDYNDAILVESVDGLYLTSVHTRDTNYGLRTAPTGATGKDTITEILGANCYFDEVYETSMMLGGTVVAGSSFQGIRFTNSVLRCGNASGGASYGEFCVDIAVTDGGGFAAGGGSVRDISIVDSNLRQARQTAVRAQGSSSSKLEVSGFRATGNTFRDNNIAGGSATSCLSLEVESAVVANNIVLADGVAPTQAFRINVSSADSGSPSLIMHDNDATNGNSTGDPFVYTTVSGANVVVHHNLRPGKGKTVDETFKATTSARSAVILWSAVVEPEGQVGDVVATVVGCSTSGTAGSARATVKYECSFYRTSAGSATITDFSTIRSRSNLTSNDYPVALKLLTGTAWVAGAGATAGDMITSGGRVYLALVTGTLDASTAPTHTSSTVANGTVPLCYVSATAANTLALFSVGMSATDMVWQGRVEYQAAP